MSQTTSKQGDRTRDPDDRDPYRRKVQQTASDGARILLANSWRKVITDRQVLSNIMQ